MAPAESKDDEDHDRDEEGELTGVMPRRVAVRRVLRPDTLPDNALDRTRNE